MINLLNPDDLKQLRAARLNVRLRRYLVITLVALVGVAGIYAFGFKLANDDYQVAQQENAKAQEQFKGYANLKNDATTFRKNLSVASKILGNEVRFSNFLTDLAKLLPPDVIISDITLTTKKPSSSNTQNITQIKARAKDYDDVLNLKTNLEKSPMFSDVKIRSTSTPSDTKTLAGVEITYPYQVIFDVVIVKYGVQTP